MSEDRETSAGAPAPEEPTEIVEAESVLAAETVESAEAVEAADAGAVESPDPEPVAPAASDPAPAAEAAPAHQTQPVTETRPGEPVEESEATATEVLAAVDRAGELNAENAVAADAAGGSDMMPAATRPFEQTPDAATTALPATTAESVAEPRPTIAMPDEMPSAGPSPTAVTTPLAPPMPDDKILVSANHPMAALYMQTPMPPDLRGNRGAGVLIGVLATLAFAVLFAAVLVFWGGGPLQPIPALLQLGLWPLVAAAGAFFIGIALLVLIVGRAGWWAYVLGGFLVGALVWAATIAGLTYSTILLNGTIGLNNLVTGGEPGGSVTVLGLVQHFGLQLPAVAAGVIAREVTVWFGAWIGARGRKITRGNAEAVAEYEAALAEAQAKQLP